MSEYWNVIEEGFLFKPDFSTLSEWQILNPLLESLYVDDRASRKDDGYLISHETASKMNWPEREGLHLPSSYPYSIQIHTEGTIGRPNYRIILRFLKPDKQPFINPEVIGSFIDLDGKRDGFCYIFSYDQYMILQTAEKCNRCMMNLGSRDEYLTYGYAETAKVKEYGNKTDAELDNYLKNTRVVNPDRLSIDVVENTDGTYRVDPVLLKKRQDGYTRVGENFSDAFMRVAEPQSHYTDKNRTRYVLNPEQVKALKPVKSLQHIDEETARRVAQQPREFFESEEFTFDAENYSDRVEGIGDVILEKVPYMAGGNGDWLPAEGTTGITEDHKQEEMPEVTEENAEQISQLIQNAGIEGKDTFEFAGKKYTITAVLTDKINKILQKDNPLNEKEETKKTLKTAQMQIRQNINELNYKAKERKVHYPYDLENKITEGLNPNIQLYDHQRQGVSHMLKCWVEGHKGILLADDMGLGKTLQALALISGLKVNREGDSPSVLIVAPVTLLENWKEEYYRFVRDGVFDGIVELYAGNIKKYKKASLKLDDNHRKIKMLDISPIAQNHIVLTTYETLRDYQVSLGQVEWSVAIIDEAQKIKNPNSGVSHAVRGMKYDFGIALTGTPVENSWVDLWTIMDFVEPGKLNNLKTFIDNYPKRLDQAGRDPVLIESLGKNLRNDLEPLFIRRMKTDIADDLPLKTIQKKIILMPQIQRIAYNQAVMAARSNQGNAKGNQILKVIARLRDISLCPYLGTYNLDKLGRLKPDEVFNSSARLMATFQTLMQIRGKDEKVLIFVISRTMQILLRRVISEVFNISVPAPINGTMRADLRQQEVMEFNAAKGFQVLILSPEAAGTGLNIVGANHVIHLSRCWNPAKEDQATDRVYRIGQTKDVTVYIPMAKSPDYEEGASFDENLDKLLEYKRTLSEKALYPTGDSKYDGAAIYDSLIREKKNDKPEENPYWTIEDMDDITGEIFEHVITNLYNNMGQFKAEKTPNSGDRGADIIVTSKTLNLLIQCKQTSSGKNMNPGGVQEIVTALNPYSRRMGRTFKGVVITNAPDFTREAKELARANGIELIAREGLAEKLKKYPLKKGIYGI